MNNNTTLNSSQTTPNQPHRRALLILVVCAIVALVCVTLLISAMRSQNSQVSSGASEAGEISSSSEHLDQQVDSYAPRQTNQDLLGYLKKITRGQEQDERALGKIDAPVVMLEFSDFSCPMCYRFELNVLPKLQPLIDNGTLRIEQHNRLVFDQQYNSAIGARAAFAAGKQGKFWQFTAATAKYSAQQEHSDGDAHIAWTEEIAHQIAKQAGISDLEKFKADFASDEIAQAVTQDEQLSQRLGLAGTPAFLINDRYLEGAQEPSVFQAVIQVAEKEAKAGTGSTKHADKNH